MTPRQISSAAVRAILILLLLGSCVPAVNTTTTWTFNGDGLWTDAANWSNGEPVDSTFDVLIDDGDTPVTVTLGASRTISTLALGTDDTLRIEAPSSGNIALTSANGFANAGRIVVANSTAGQVASLVIQSGTLTND